MKSTVTCVIIFVVFVFLLALAGRASTNDLPAASGGAVSVDSNGMIRIPTGFLSTNGIARVNPAVLLFDESFVGWGTADGVTWTNSTGWASTAVVTNGVCNLATNSLLSPWITGRGLEAINVTWSNLVLLSPIVEYSTNDVDWLTLSDLEDLRIASLGCRLRFTAIGSAPPLSTPAALLDRVMIWGHQFPGRIGTTNDFAGLVLRVDNPLGSRDAVNLQTLEARLSAYVMGGHSAEGWSQFQASNTVNLAGYPLQLDTRYALSVVGDAVTLSLGGTTLFEIVGGNTCTPRIVSFRISGTNLSADVVGVTGWRPYPQWTTSLISPSWTSLATNQFSSTFPNITNGMFRINWNTGTNTTEYWRILADDETGITNGSGMATFHTPVSVPALWVNGREVSPYSPSWVSNADYAASAGTAAVSIASVYADHSGSASTATVASVSGYATSAGSASAALYSSDGAHAARADLATSAAYATNAGTAAAATYATTAGFATSAGNSSKGTIGGGSKYFGTAAAADTNDFTPRTWITSIRYATNLFVAATNGAGYNGPPLGTVFDVNHNPINDGWYATNSFGNRAQLFQNGATNIYKLQEMFYWYASFTNSSRSGTYTGITETGANGTGTLTIAEAYYWATNTIPYFADGTATLARIQGPATNQFAPPLPLIRWSGPWTNILSGHTNVLLFSDGYATNMVPL